MILAGLGLLVLGALSWRTSVVAALVLMVVDGALRKWFLPQLQDFLYFAKDILLGGAYLRFYGGKLIRQSPLILKHPLNALLGLLIAYGMAEVFNPSLPSVSVGLFGFKAYFYYLPLAYMVAELARSREELLRGLLAYTLLSLPVSSLGVLQFFSPPESPLVSYLQWDAAFESPGLSMVGEFPRVSGTFSYISGFSAYLSTMVLSGVALLGLRSLGRWRWLVLGGLVLAAVALLMTGSRGPVAVLLPVLPLLMAMTGRARMALRSVVAVLVAAAAIYAGFRPAVEAFVLRSMATDDVVPRVALMFAEPLDFAMESSFWGAGIGSTHQGARFLVGEDSYSWLPPVEFEAEPGRIMLELGIPGFTLFYAMKLAMLLSCLLLATRLQDPELRVLNALCFGVQWVFLLQHTVFNVTAAICFWVAAGFLFLLPRLDPRQAASDTAPEPKPAERWAARPARLSGPGRGRPESDPRA